MMLQVNPLEDCGKVPPAALLREKVYVSTAYIICAQNLCVSSINVGMSASLFYTRRNVYSLIRPKKGNGSLIAQPGHNVFLRETFLSHLGDHKIWQWKANTYGLPFTGNYSQKVTTTPESSGIFTSFPSCTGVKNPPANTGETRDVGSTPGSGRRGLPSLEEEMATHSSHYSCLENSMDRGVWWATVHGVTKSQIQLSAWACAHQWNIYGEVG